VGNNSRSFCHQHRPAEILLHLSVVEILLLFVVEWLAEIVVVEVGSEEFVAEAWRRMETVERIGRTVVVE